MTKEFSEMKIFAHFQKILVAKRFNKIHTVLSIFYAYLAAPSGGNVFDDTSSWNSWPPPPSLYQIRLFGMRHLSWGNKPMSKIMVWKYSTLCVTNTFYYFTVWEKYRVDKYILNFETNTFRDAFRKKSGLGRENSQTAESFLQNL